MINNEVLETIKKRRSAKSYSNKDIDKELLEKILEAGTYAASGRGAQSPVLVCVTNKEERDLLSKLNAAVMGVDSDPFYKAKVVVVVLADSLASTWIEDGSLALGNMMLAATSLGVDSCWIHRARQVFDSLEGKELLKKWGLSENYRGVGNLILGYKDKDFMERKPRKDNYIIWR